jgi:hypothetical protein
MITGRHRQPGGKMGRGANGSHPVQDLLIEQWPSLVLLPAVLVLLVVLIAVTRWWDQRDEARSAEREARRVGNLSRPRAAEAITIARVRAVDRSRRPWRRRTRCTCSWHTVGLGR